MSLSIDRSDSICTKITRMPVDGVRMKICACLPVVNHVALYVKNTSLAQLSVLSAETDRCCDETSTLANTMWYWTPVQLFTSAALLSVVAPASPAAFAVTCLYNVINYRMMKSNWEEFSYDVKEYRKKVE